MEHPLIVYVNLDWCELRKKVRKKFYQGTKKDVRMTGFKHIGN